MAATSIRKSWNARKDATSGTLPEREFWISPPARCAPPSGTAIRTSWRPSNELRHRAASLLGHDSAQRRATGGKAGEDRPQAAAQIASAEHRQRKQRSRDQDG